MIARLKGLFVSYKDNTILIDVNNIAYEVEVSSSDCEKIKLLNYESVLVIYTHFIIREDLHALYGFLEMGNRDLFRVLIKVGGIGPKIALAILSTLNKEQIISAVELNAVDILCTVPGIGKKVAERLILELKGKLLLIDNLLTFDKSISNKYANDIISALKGLGFNDRNISQVLSKLPNDIKDISAGVKLALQLIKENK